MLIYVTHFFTAFVGAEWWAQSFGKSVPFLSWVPFVNGKFLGIIIIVNFMMLTILVALMQSICLEAYGGLLPHCLCMY
ncbi:choline/ethanolaminephosphotransferase 2 [Phtheirospermum japonicum]|uniref:Choline/ethanolaminephosphotransferase 2 n=1 Tax=Phtheirospermum japonicum TaxID=374723 RepID=A0A830CI68_9LAMI|nr:choline/ethanolaminephosphotransferase 2 [Phtheirospermum japonicum]